MFELLTIFAGTTCDKPRFFGLVPWYEYLPMAYNSATKSCEVSNSFQLLGSGSNSGLLLIVLAIVQNLLVVAGLAAVGYVIYAGIKYITSQGSPDETSKAQSTLINALVGMVIALISVGVVSYLGNRLGGANAPGGGTGLDVGSLPNTSANTSTVQAVLSVVFGVIGALSLLFVTIGGFRYITAQGDPQGTTRARNTILYALVGLIVAMVAQAIVSFVMGRATT